MTTVSLEDLFCTFIVDGHKGLDVTTFDIPGAYLIADIPKGKRILMKLRWDFFNIVCQVNPEYEQYVRYENGEKVVYLLVIRAVYGFIEAALLWYNILSITLEGVVFETSPYYMCVENKVVEGTQCTIDWYVDENKLLHKNPEVISDIINIVKKNLESYLL